MEPNQVRDKIILSAAPDGALMRTPRSRTVRRGLATVLEGDQSRVQLNRPPTYAFRSRRIRERHERPAR